MPLTLEQQKAIAIAEAKRKQALAAGTVPTAQVDQQPSPVMAEPEPINGVGFGDASALSQREMRQQANQQLEGMAARGLMLSPSAVNTLARYATPFLAGALAGPGAGAGSYMALGGIGTFLGEGMAQAGEVQTGERESIDFNKVLAEGIRGSTPVGKGRAITRVLEGTLAGAGTEYLAQNVENPGDVSGITVAGSGALQGMMGGASSILGRRAAQSQAAADIAERRGAGALLSEVAPGLKKLEAKMLNNQNRIVMNAVDNLDSGIAEQIARDFPETVNVADIATELAAASKTLQPKLDAARIARDEAAAVAQAISSFREDAGFKAKDIVKKAKETALEAQKAKFVYEDGIRTVLGDTPTLSEIARGRRVDRARGLIASADEVTEQNIDKLYDDIVGLGPNDAFVTRKDFDGFIKSSARRGQPLEANRARGEIVDAIDKAFNGSETLTLEEFRRLRNTIAENLAKENAPANAINRIAGEVYQIANKASEKFIRREMPDVLKPWRLAQKTAAQSYALRSSDAIEGIRTGDPERIINAIRENGWGETLRSVNAYADFLATSGKKLDPVSRATSQEARALFLKDFYGIVRDGVIDSAMNRGAGVDFPIDAQALASEVQSLATKNFPIEKLGLGTKEQIGALARLSTRRNAAGFTVDEVQKYLDDAKKLGANPAIKRLEYARDLKETALRDGFFGIRKNWNELKNKARQAGLSVAEAEKAVQDAMKDDLVVLLNDTSMKLSKDVASNGNYVNKLLAVDPKTAGKFMDALYASGRGQSAETLKKAATASVLRGMLKVEPGGRMRIDSDAAAKLFASTEGEAKRKALRAILDVNSPGAYENLRKNWFGRIKEFNAALEALGDNPKGPRIGNIYARGGIGDVRAVGTISSIVNMVQSGRYALAYKMLVDPRYADSFRKAAYNLDTFMSYQPTNSTALRLWADEDMEDVRATAASVGNAATSTFTQ